MKKTLTILLVLVMVISCMTACAETKKKTFTYGIDSDIDDFNPMTNQMTNFITVFVFNVYEPLIHLNGNMEYEMDLATEVKQIDELTYEVALREGVTYHNGQLFTAADVINTIAYIKNEANGAWRSTQYSTVDSMVADGNYKLTIKLSTATPAFMDNLAYTPIFCKDDDPVKLSATANGTGAFKFVKWTPNDQIEFVKNDKYWDADKVSIDNLVVKPFSDYTVAITNLQAGSIDALNRVSVENALTIESKNGLKTITASTSNTVDLFEIGRHNCEPFSDPKVMQAMLLAFDANVINEAIYQGKGEVLTSCYPSGAKYHVGILSNEYDLEKAKEVLASSSYPDGFEFDCEILKGFDAGEMAAVIWQDALSKIGITMNMKVEEMSVWLESYLGRTYDMIWNQYGMVGSDPATFNSIIVEQLFDFQCKDLTDLQTLVLEAKATSDEAVRAKDYEEIQRIIAEYCPIYPYVSVPLICGARENVEGLEINGMAHVFLKNVTVK